MGFPGVDASGKRDPTTIITSGTTAQRPALASVPVGFMYFDTTVNKPIFKNAAGNGWVDGAGTVTA